MKDKLFTLRRAFKEVDKNSRNYRNKWPKLQRNKLAYSICNIKHQALQLTTMNRIGGKVQNKEHNASEHVKLRSWFQDCKKHLISLNEAEHHVLWRGCGQLPQNWPCFPAVVQHSHMCSVITMRSSYWRLK